METNKNKMNYSVNVDANTLVVSVYPMLTSHFHDSELKKQITEKIELVFKKHDYPYSKGELEVLDSIHLPEVVVAHVEKVTGNQIAIYQLATVSPPAVHPVSKSIIFVISYYEPVYSDIPLDIVVDKINVSFSSVTGIVKMEYEYMDNGVTAVRIMEYDTRKDNPTVDNIIDVTAITLTE